MNNFGLRNMEQCSVLKFSFIFQSIMGCFRVWVDFENKYFQSQTLKWQWANDEMKRLLRE